MTTVVTSRTNGIQSIMTTVPPYDDEDEEETIDSTLAVVNPQELQPDDDDAASLQLVTPPLLPPQHDLCKSDSGSNASSTLDPSLYMTGLLTPSQPHDWRDHLEHGPNPVFLMGRQHGTTLFAAVSVSRADTSMGMGSKEETKEGEPNLHDGEFQAEVPTDAITTEVTVVVVVEPQEQAREHCLDRRSTVAKLALLCWCLLAVLAALICYQILQHEPILPTL